MYYNTVQQQDYNENSSKVIANHSIQLCADRNLYATIPRCQAYNPSSSLSLVSTTFPPLSRVHCSGVSTSSKSQSSFSSPRARSITTTCLPIPPRVPPYHRTRETPIRERIVVDTCTQTMDRQREYLALLDSRPRNQSYHLRQRYGAMIADHEWLPWDIVRHCKGIYQPYIGLDTNL